MDTVLMNESEKNHTTMNTELMLDVGQANELKLAFRREGDWTNEDIKALTERKGLLREVREVLLGRAEIKQVSYLVDLDSAPFIPDGWSAVEEHKEGGQLKWDQTKVRLHLADGQKNGKYIEGNKIRKEIAKLSPYNANLLDFLLKKENQHLIPEDWKGKAVFFWGTIYRDSDGHLYVRYLSWSDRQWLSYCYWLGHGWYGNHPAAVPAS